MVVGNTLVFIINIKCLKNFNIKSTKRAKRVCIILKGSNQGFNVGVSRLRRNNSSLFFYAKRLMNKGASESKWVRWVREVETKQAISVSCLIF